MKTARAPPMMVLLALAGLLTVSNGAGWATVRTTITLADSANQNSAVDKSTALGSAMLAAVSAVFREALEQDEKKTGIFAYMSKGDSDADVVAVRVIKDSEAQDSTQARTNVDTYLDNNLDLTAQRLNDELSSYGQGNDKIASVSQDISTTASASQSGTFMAAIKLGKPEYQVLMRENKEAVMEAAKRVLITELPYLSVSNLEMAPVFVDFVAATLKAEVHGAENAEVAKMIYKEFEGEFNSYGLNEELESEETGLPDRDDKDPSYVQRVYSHMLLGSIEDGSGSGDTTVSGTIQVNDSRIVDGMVGNGNAIIPFRRMMLQASRAFPAVDFLGVGLNKGSTDRELKIEVALRVNGVQSNEAAAQAVRNMWETNESDLMKYASDVLDSVSGGGLGYEVEPDGPMSIQIYGIVIKFSSQDVTFNPGQDVSRYSVDGSDAEVTATIQMKAPFRDQLFKQNTTYPRVLGAEMATTMFIASDDPDLYVKGVKISEGSGDNVNVRALITVRDSESSTAARNTIQSLLDARPITKELINAGFIEEFGIPRGNDEWVSGVGSVQVAAAPEQESLTVALQLSGVEFTQSDFDGNTEEYRKFKRNFEGDAEAKMSDKCGCTPEVRITSVTFDGDTGRRLQNTDNVTVTSEVNGVSQDDVSDSLDPSNGSFTLGGATVTRKPDVKLTPKEDDPESPETGDPQGGAGDALSCSALLALVLSVAAVLA